MSDDRDELLREIGAALTIEPSPSFAAGVREWVAAERHHVDAPRSLVERGGRRGVRGHDRGGGRGESLVGDGGRGARRGVVAAVPAAVNPLPDAAASRARRRDSRAVAPSPRVARAGAGSAPRQPVVVAATALAARRGGRGPDMTVVTNQGAILRAVWVVCP